MLDRELEIAVDAARRAGAAVREVWTSEDFEVRQKADGKGPLTEADLASNAILEETLRQHFPDDGLLSEESLDDRSRLERARCWIIDPLDGTREFTMQLPEFCVSIGLVDGDEAVLGVLFNPATGELVTGVRGRGVQIDGTDAQTTDHGAIEGARLLVSRSEHSKGWFESVEEVAELQPMGSVAWKLALVAAGRAEATFTPKPRNAWDLCGGVACVLAGGGCATDGSAEPYRFNQPDPLKIGVCGTNGAIHDRILELMKR